MTTLTTPPCSAVAAKLFAEAAASDARLDAQRRALPSGDPGTPMTRTKDYRALYGALKDFHVAVLRETAPLPARPVE